MSASPHAIPRARAARIAVIAVVVLAGLVALYAAAGFVLAPWLAKRELPQFAESELQSRARVADIAFNPFTLVLRVTGLVLEDKNGRPLLAVQEGVADFEWRSVVRRGVILSALRLNAPEIHVEISEEGRLNLAALMPRAREDTGSKEPLRVAVGHLAIADGRIDFADRRERYEQSIEELSLELSALSTLESKDSAYKLTAQTRDGARLRWNGQLALQPLVASGVLALNHSALPQLNPYLDDTIAAHIKSGRADLEVPYRFWIEDGKPRIEVHNARLLLQDLALALRDAEAPFARIGRLALDGIAVNTQARRFAAEALRMADFSVTAHRDANGAVDLERLLPGKADEPAGAAWQGRIGTAELSNGSASLSDEVTGLDVTLVELGGNVTGLALDASEDLVFELATALNGGGRIALNGRAAPRTRTVKARIEASGVPLAVFQPVVAQHAQIRIVSGEAALAGNMTMGEDAALTYDGSASLTNVAIDDPSNTRLVGWNSLSTKALRASVQPTRVEIDELRWAAPAGRFAIAADRTTNVGRLLGRKDTAAPKEGAARKGEEPAYIATVRRMLVEDGRLEFSDESITPGFTAHMHELAGTVNGISTDRNTRSQLALEGRVDEHGYARISGGLNVFEPSERTNVRVQFRNIDVTKASPYAMKFAGYRIASGRLSLDLSYSVRDNLLQGDNKIVLEQFTLGERVESPDALDLPLELAVALLKDENGVIDVAIPISGNLNDPNFDFSAAFWKVIGNVVSSVVTAPFRALGRLFGADGEDLGAIAFEPGSSRLLPPEREKIQRIAEALKKRPQLKVEVPASYDPKVDADALKRAALRREIAKRAGFEVKAEDPAAPISIEDQRTRDAMRALFAERFSEEALEQLKAEAEAKAAAAAENGKPAPRIPVFERLRKFARGEPQVADLTPFYRELGRRLLAAQPLPEGALEELAQHRAESIAAALKEAGLDAARISQTQPKPAAKAEQKQVLVQLSLAPL